MATFVELLYGPMFIGVMLNIMLYGVMFTQTYMYFNMYKDDRRWLKLFVVLLFLLESANTGLDIATIFHALINRFGDLDAVSKASWMFATDPAITAVVATLVQLFFAWRLKVLTSNLLVVTAVVLCSITQLLTGIGCSVTLAIDPPFSNVKISRVGVVSVVWISSAALANIIIATSLIRHVRGYKSGAESFINKTISLSVQTGCITALCAIATLVLYFATSAGYDLIFHMPLAKLYTNSLMSTLNSRRMWLADVSDESESLGHNQRRSRLNVNVLRGEPRGWENKSTRTTERIIIGVESHQMTDFGDIKDDHYTLRSRSLIPEEKSREGEAM